MNIGFKILLAVLVALGLRVANGQQSGASIDAIFRDPPESAKPWVLWYWMHGAVSKEGITADLEGLRNNGIGGVYLACIYDTVSRIPYPHPARQLSPQWWEMINHALRECKRLGMKMSLHMSDGFALAGGPWIKPEQSMQKLVWTKTYVKAPLHDPIVLEQPKANENFYKDVAVFAYPANCAQAFSDTVLVPTVITSTGERASYLAFPIDDTKSFKSDTACWIQYKYPSPFTIRSLKIRTGGNNYQALRLTVLAGYNGIEFDTIIKLQPPRHGWQDSDEDYTFSIPATTAMYFRFLWSKDGSEPGAEDLDAAKWKPSLKVKGIYLSDEPVINQIEAKNGSVWRVATNTDELCVRKEDAIPFDRIINITDKMDEDGQLHWTPPYDANWIITRIGHTSTGHTNATGGAAKGLECDKFDAEAIKLHFDNWFGKVFEMTDPGLAREVLKIFYIDSWEAGSQNWSKNFLSEFKARRGYDLLPYLLVMTGTPIEDAATSERILHDVRETIAELVNDIFYKTLRKLSAEKDCEFMAENVSPTMVSDGLLHFKTVDYPTGEFWLHSPTHDKPNDMLDAISAAHIYGKNIVQAEAFTNLRMAWTEHPGNIKVVGDRNFAMGINRMVLHVMTHNPWLDRKPGMTLSNIGLFYQRDQTWFKQSRAWIDYMTRVSAMLQYGKPVADIAVFTGEEVPRRSILPDRLVNTLPGIFGKERLLSEQKRLENKDQPLRTIPDGVKHSANMADPEDWTDALRGYKYDCFNPDALLGAKVKNKKVVFESGAEYAILVFPGKLLMNPNSHLMSLHIARKLLELSRAGAIILIDKGHKEPIGFKDNSEELQKIWKALLRSRNIIDIPYMEETFARIGVERDLDATANKEKIAWTHRKTNNEHIYFVSNQESKPVQFTLSFRVKGYTPEIADPVTGSITPVSDWRVVNGRTIIVLPLDTHQSVFIIFRKKTKVLSTKNQFLQTSSLLDDISSNWSVQFDQQMGGPTEVVDFPVLQLWNEKNDPRIKYYSGSAIYKRQFSLSDVNKDSPIYLIIDSVFNIASVSINGKYCGTLWTAPYRLDISDAIRKGINNIEITVTNTWLNRLLYDISLPEKKRITWTSANLELLKGKSLQKAGISGRIRIEQ